MDRLPAIIDVEASGFGHESYPIEVGVVDATGHRFCTLITPATHWTFWDAQAEATHHIQREQLMEHGKTIVDVAKALNEQFEGQTLYSDGWVVDKPWLIRLFEEAGIAMAFSISPLELILNESQMNNWHEIKDKVTLDLALERHRASNDALIIQETYRRTRLMVAQPS
jgi:hypothetical protein